MTSMEPVKTRTNTLEGKAVNAQGATRNDEKFLASLALALLENPAATLQELARALGVSKATLYRFCPTRDQLVERLMEHATHSLSQAIRSAELERDPPLEALRRLTVKSLENQELTLFLTFFWRPGASIEEQAYTDWMTALDAFFLRGQQAGVFRIDISAAAMTELWISILIGLQDAERRGRVARVGLPALFELSFLHGTTQV